MFVPTIFTDEVWSTGIGFGTGMAVKHCNRLKFFLYFVSVALKTFVRLTQMLENFMFSDGHLYMPTNASLFEWYRISFGYFLLLLSCQML